MLRVRRAHYPHASEHYGLFLSSGTGADSSGTDHGDDLRIGHGGGDPGVSTSMQFSPALQAGVIIFRNGTPGEGATKAMYEEIGRTGAELESAAWELAAAL